MAPINPVYFVVSDSSSSASGSGSRSGSGSSTGSAAVASTPVESRAGGSYFDPQPQAESRLAPRGYAHLLLGTQDKGSRASSITSLGSGSEDDDEQEEDQREEDIEDEVGGGGFGGQDSDITHQQASSSGTSASAPARSHRGHHSPHTAPPPRVTDFFPTTHALRQQANEALAAHASATTHGPYASSLIDNPAPPARKKRRYCPEPNCCGNALSHPGKIGGEDDATRVHDLFWKRQLWLMEHRGADGLSHCGSDGEGEEEEITLDVQEEAQDREEEDPATPREPTPPSMVMAKHRRALALAAHSSSGGSSVAPHLTHTAASHDQVLRTAGAGLPLARVKRVMKGADEEIKMISHEAPSLLSRLCTVLIADLSVRAGRHALGQGRRTISPRDLMEVTVGSGEGSGAEWEFLRDVVEGKEEE